MAIYWVDPHIGAAVQANGTTSTTIRDGSYASPWSIADVSATSSTTLPTKMAALVSGDEIRFKGLPIETYTIELPNTTFRNAATTGGSVTDFRTTNVTDSALITTDYVGTGATIWPRFLYVNSIPALGGERGFLPIYNITNQTTYFQFSGGSTWNPGYGYTAMGSANFSARIVKYKEYGIDINTLVGSNAYIFPRLPNGVTVTSGWTSSTVRDGVTLLLLWSSAQSNVYWCYQSSTYQPTTGTFDCPELYMLHGAKAGNTTTGLFTIGAGGPGQTHSLGGCANSYSTGTSIALFSSPGATLDIRFIYSSAYGANHNGNVASGSSSFSNLILRNLVCGYTPQNNLQQTSTNYTIGNVHGGSHATTSYPLQFSTTTGATAPTYTLLANSIYTVYGSATQHVIFGNALPQNLTAPSTITNTFTGRITGVGTYPGTGERPLVLFSYTARGLASQKLNATLNENIAINTSVTNMNEGLYYVGELDTGGADYKSATTTSIIDGSSTALTSDISRSYVYQSNSYDGRPVMMMISGDHLPCLLYNDSTKNEALTWHQLASSATKYFQKDIPVAIPAYTTEQVDFQAVYSTSTTFNGSMVMELWTVNSQTGAATMQSSVTVASGNLVDSQMNITLSNSTLTTNNVKTAYLRMKLTAGSNAGQKFWLQSVTATLPTP